VSSPEWRNGSPPQRAAANEISHYPSADHQQPSAPGRQREVTVRTHIPPDMSSTGDELRAEVHRLVDPVVQAAQATYGPIPGVGAAAWWTAPVEVKIAAICILGEAYLITDPERMAVQMLKDAAIDLSQARSWTDATRLPSHSELLRRRYPAGGDVERWVREGPPGHVNYLGGPVKW
jgi:hypothetical protein